MIKIKYASKRIVNDKLALTEFETFHTIFEISVSKLLISPFVLADIHISNHVFHNDSLESDS